MKVDTAPLDSEQYLWPFVRAARWEARLPAGISGLVFPPGAGALRLQRVSWEQSTSWRPLVVVVTFLGVETSYSVAPDGTAQQPNAPRGLLSQLLIPAFTSVHVRIDQPAVLHGVWRHLVH